MEARYIHKKINRFRIAKLSEREYRLEYQYRYLGFIPVWKTNLLVIHMDDDNSEYVPKIFSKLENAERWAHECCTQPQKKKKEKVLEYIKIKEADKSK
jgi:hypothetical protein